MQTIESSPAARPRLLGGMIMTLCHTLLLLGVLYYLLVMVPRYKEIYEGFGMKLPAVTQVLIDISDLVVGLLPMFAFLALLAVVADGFFIHSLRSGRQNRLVLWLWFVLVFLVLGGNLLFGIMVMELPHLELTEALAR